MPSTSSSPRALGRHSPRLARLRQLVRDPEPGVAVVDGPKLVAELLAAGVEIIEVYGTAAALASVAGPDSRGRVPPPYQAFEVDPATLKRMAPTRQTQGLVAVARYRSQPLPFAGVVLFLEAVQDPGNVGAVVRCAAALGAAGVACSPGCGDPFSPKAIRASAGSSLLFPVATQAGFAELATRFGTAGGVVAGTVGAGGMPAHRWAPARPLLLALGNEGHGLSEATLSLCHQLITLPLARPVESLNVAVTAGILLAGLAGLVPSPILELRT